MKKLSILFLILVICTGCFNEKQAQEQWIKDNLPQFMWQDITYNQFNEEYKRVSSVLVDYCTAQLDKYHKQTVNMYYGNSWESEFLRAMDNYATAVGESSYKEDRLNTANRYKSACEAVMDRLCENLGYCLHLRDSCLIGLDCELSDSYLCANLMGTPDKVAKPSDEEEKDIARYIAIDTFQRIPRPVVSSVEYDNEIHTWYVRFDNADNQYVKFYVREDGQFDVEYSSEIDSHGTPVTDRTSTISLR
jgi:hypothetical protein